MIFPQIVFIQIIAVQENGNRIVDRFYDMERAIEYIEDLKKEQIWGPITDSPVEHRLGRDGQTFCGWYYTDVAPRKRKRKYRKCKLCW